MARTFVGVNDPKAVKKYSTMLSALTIKESFFGSSAMMGRGPESRKFIQRVDDLKKDHGDTISVDLLMPMKMDPIVGADQLDGNEERLQFYTDKIVIDQVRGGADLGDKMSRKRTVVDMRKAALRAHKDWWKRVMDEIIFIYASGTRGTQNGFVWSANNRFLQTNPLTAPDSVHQFYGGAATSLASMVGTDLASLSGVDKLIANAEMMGGDATEELSMIPADMGEGENGYSLLVHPWAALAIRTNTNPGQWLDIQKAAAAAEGSTKNPIFKGTSTLGYYNGCLIKKHRNIITQAAGASGTLTAARNLFFGVQGVLVAMGSPGDIDMPFDWTEMVKDHGDKIAIGTNCIMGVKKSTYITENGARDFGVMAYDTVVVKP